MEGSSSEEYVSADEGIDERQRTNVEPAEHDAAPKVGEGTSPAPEEDVEEDVRHEDGSLQSPPVDEPLLSPSPTIDRREESALVPEAEDPPPVDESPLSPSPTIDRRGESALVPDPPPGDEPSLSPSPSPTIDRRGESALVPEAEDPPVPPPRRKRKKKPGKQHSLENLTEIEDHSNRQRSMTLDSTDSTTELSRPTMKTQGQPSSSGGDTSSRSLAPDLVQPQEAGLEPQLKAEGDADQCQQGERDDSEMVSEKEEPGQPHQQRNEQHAAPSTLASSSLLSERSSRSRSVTPTPAISIEPDLGLQWTADMLSIPESEVVTSDTSLAKARGSNTTTSSSVVFPSDDESLDGDHVFGDDTPEEGGEGDSEGAGEGGGEGGGVDSTDLGTLKQTVEQVQVGEGKRPTSAPVDSDNAILASTMVTNLDTGEVIPLSAAEERIPQGHGWSPLSEHLLRRTNEAAGQPGFSYEEDYTPHHPRKARKKAFINLKKWGRKRERGGADENASQSDELPLNLEDKYAVKYKQASHKQQRQEFEKVRLKQDLTGTHLGAIWSMEFSICGRLLATAGQDSVVRVWVLATAAPFFHELQTQYQRLGVHSSVDSLSEKASVASSSSKSSEEDDSMGGKVPFQDHPLCSYYGHTADVLDLSWSKNFFLLSSSMDKTVRLWHISRKECLCCFQHVDFVTAIAFHPRDDRYFLSGSLDGKLRLWNIPDKKVALWNEIEGVGSHLITAANFCMNGKLAVVGTYDGRCIFYDTEHLKYHTQIHVKSRHGKNKGRKISGVEPLPGEDKLLVTSNDSRIRLYNLKDHELSCKYKGCINTSSQIKATFSRDGQYIISGSEDNFIYLWKTHLDISKLSSSRRDRNEFYESFSSHSAPVTTAVFAPVPGITVDEGIKEVGEIIVAADYQGCIKIYVSGEKL